MIKNIRKPLHRQKLNVFLICLICSFTAWSISKLSETHSDAVSYALNFAAAPDSLVFNQASRQRVDLTVRANGFQFLAMQFRSKTLDVRLDQVRRAGLRYYLPRHLFLSQIESQLPVPVSLLEVEGDTLFIDFFPLRSKRVPVIANVTIELGQNHLLEDGVQVEPDSVVLHGPQGEIERVSRLTTIPVTLDQVTEDFNREIALQIPEGWKHTRVSNPTVHLAGRVFRFSEKIVEVPVSVINLPEGTQINMFPTQVPVLCKARVEDLKDITASDFQVIADYSEVAEDATSLTPRIAEKPDQVHTAQLLETQIEFILKRE